MMEIPERFIYYDGKDFYFHNIKTGENITTIPKDFIPTDYDLTDDESSTAFGFDDNHLIIVTDHNRRSSSIWSRDFVILKFDIYFKMNDVCFLEEAHGQPETILRERTKRAVFNNESFVKQFSESKISFPYGIQISPIIFNHGKNLPDLMMNKERIDKICYDRFDNFVVILFKSLLITAFGYCPLIEIWKEEKDKLQLVRRSDSLDEVTDKNSSGAYHLYKVKRLECTMNYILLVLNYGTEMYRNTCKRIVIIDKKTFKVIRIMNGWHATYCDYGDWYTCSFGKMLEIEDLKKMSHDLLKLILSYVL